MRRRHWWIRRPRCSWKFPNALTNKWLHQWVYNRLPVETHGRPINTLNSRSQLSIDCMNDHFDFWVMTQSCWRPLFLIVFRLPRAQADGKGQAVKEEARVDKLAPENSARRKPNRSTCSLGQSLLDPLGLNTLFRCPRFVWYACWPAGPAGGGRFNQANHEH